MDQTSEATLLKVVLIGMLGMGLLAFAVVIFFVIYQRRLLRQQHINQEMKSNYQKELLRASINSQEKERLRIAQSLHDGIGALLSTAKLHLGQISSDTPSQKLTDRIKSSNDILTETLLSVKQISLDLKPPVLEMLGLIAAVRSLVQTINDSGQIKISFSSPEGLILKEEESLGCYRIIQELIQNGLKHSCAKKIDLKINQKGQSTIIEYSDNGIGFDFNQKLSSNNNGLGLKNIESRLNLLNGRIYAAKNTDTGGTYLIVETHTHSYGNKTDD